MTCLIQIVSEKVSRELYHMTYFACRLLD